jgi:hypothetical protein
MIELRKTLLVIILSTLNFLAISQTKPCVHLRGGEILYFDKVVANELSQSIKCFNSKGEKTVFTKIDVESAVIGKVDKPKSLKQVLFVNVNAINKSVSAGNRVMKVAMRSGENAILYFAQSTSTPVASQPKTATGKGRSPTGLEPKMYYQYCYINNGMYKEISKSMTYKNYSVLFTDMQEWFSDCEKVVGILEKYVSDEKKLLNVYKVLIEIEAIYYAECYVE